MKKTFFCFLFSVFCFLISNIYAQEVSTNIKGLLSSQGKIFYGNEPNSIMVIDYPENIQRAAEYLEVVDILPQQVLIEARVVEVKLQKEHSLGVNWKVFADKGYIPLGRFKGGRFTSLGAPPVPLEQTIAYKSTVFPPGQTTGTPESPFTFAIFDDNINVVLQTLATSLDTDILSAPKITTVNNQEAEIKITQKLPWAEPSLSSSTGAGGGTTISVTWEVNFEEVGIKLKVTPIINDDGEVSLTIIPEVSEKTGDLTLTVSEGGTSINYTVPIIDTRTASTKVVVGNGQTLIIGGMIKNKTTKGASKVPLLGDIPVLGYLFKSSKDTQDKTELLIFVSPKIITTDEVARMAREEKFGIGRWYVKDRERQEQMAVSMELAEKSEKEKVIKKLDSLDKEWKDLLEERKGREEIILKEEEGLKELKAEKDKMIEERQ